MVFGIKPYFGELKSSSPFPYLNKRGTKNMKKRLLITTNKQTAYYHYWYKTLVCFWPHLWIMWGFKNEDDYLKSLTLQE